MEGGKGVLTDGFSSILVVSQLRRLSFHKCHDSASLFNGGPCLFHADHLRRRARVDEVRAVAGECVTIRPKALEVVVSVNHDAVVEEFDQIMTLRNLALVQHQVGLEGVFGHHVSHFARGVGGWIVRVEGCQVEKGQFMLSLAKPLARPLANVLAQFGFLRRSHTGLSLA